MQKVVKKKIKASKRPKKRYLLFGLWSDKSLFAPDVKGALFGFLKSVFAQDFEKKMVFVVLFDEKKSMGILKCSHIALNDVKKAVLGVSHVHGVPVRAQVLLASGSIGKLKGKIRAAPDFVK